MSQYKRRQPLRVTAFCLTSVSRFGASQHEPCGDHKRSVQEREGGAMNAPELDFAGLSEIHDPGLRAAIEGLGRAIVQNPRVKLPPEEKKPESQRKNAKVIQFPLFPEETRPVTNDIARSALFSCVQGKDRRMLEKALLATIRARNSTRSA